MVGKRSLSSNARSSDALALSPLSRPVACGDRAPWQNVVVLWQSGGSWLLGLLHATLLRRSITVDERLVARDGPASIYRW